MGVASPLFLFSSFTSNGIKTLNSLFTPREPGRSQTKKHESAIDEACHATGLWDQGFISGRVRTDYDSPSKGTIKSPLTLTSCLFTDGDPIIIPAGPSWDKKSCSLSPTIYARSNAYTNSSHWPMDNFWVLSVNNEPAYQKKFNSGPPNQSLPISEPGKGIIGFAVKKKRYKNKLSSKAILSLDHSFAPSGAEGYIPFLGIGAHWKRGNSKPISFLNPSEKHVPQKILFTATMLKEKNIGKKGTAGILWFIASAEWDGKQRMIFIAIHHNGLEHETSSGNFIHGHWNWNIKESFYYPGGDLVYMDAEDLSAIGMEVPPIIAVGQEHEYAIDLQKLFELGSRNINGVTFDKPLPPRKNIPVTGVHWAVEMTGKNTSLWFAVQHMMIR